MLKSKNNELNQDDTLALLILRDRSRQQREAFLEQFLNSGHFVASDLELSTQEIETSALELEAIKAAGNQVVTFLDSSYPPQLRQIADPPLVLCVKAQSLQSVGSVTCVSIVGSRRASSTGMRLARVWAKELAQAGACVVSGLAYGIDGEAHAGALESKHDLPTMAVLGHGLGAEIYPRAHRQLADRIVQNGGVLISQFPNAASPLPGNFINRNRIVAGLSSASIVIQAGVRSGALVTARAAAESGRDVLVVPGAIDDPLYVGSLQLLRQGASIVTSIEEVFEYLSPLERGAVSIMPKLSERQAQVLNSMKPGASCEIEHLQRLIADSGELALLLGQLEMMGLISKLPGMQIMRN